MKTFSMNLMKEHEMNNEHVATSHAPDGSPVVISDPWEGGEFQLLEIPPELLQIIEQTASKIDSNGESKKDEKFTRNRDQRVVLTIRGDLADEAVVCSSTTSYIVRRAEVSSSLLLLSGPAEKIRTGEHGGMSGVLTIHDRLQEYCEVIPCVPRTNKLYALLSTSTYGSQAYDQSKDAHESGKAVLSGNNSLWLPSWAYLQKQVQASDQELRKALEDMDALEIDGYWRRVDVEFMGSFLDVLYAVVQANGWSFSHIPLHTCLRELSAHEDFHEQISRGLLEILSRRSDPSIETLDTELSYISIEMAKVARHRAMQLFRLGKKWRVSEFSSAWSALLPDGKEPDMSILLDGYAIIDHENEKDTDGFIVQFPRYTLSFNIRERFQQLFVRKSQWQLEELRPYLRDLVGTDKELENLLLKYARRLQTHKGGALYTNRAIQ